MLGHGGVYEGESRKQFDQKKKKREVEGWKEDRVLKIYKTRET